MGLETTWVAMNGPVAVGQSVAFPSVSYTRQVLQVTIAAGEDPVNQDLQLQLSINGTAQSQIFTLTQNTGGPYTATILGGGYTLAANSILSVTVIQAGGALDLTITISSQVSPGKECIWQPFPGSVLAGTTVPFPPASYDRTINIVTLIAGTAPTAAGGANVQLIVGGVEQAQVFNLPLGVNLLQITVVGGIPCPANTSLSVIVNTAGGALDMVVNLENNTNQIAVCDTWVTPTQQNVQAYVSAQEYQAFTGELLEMGQSDPVPQLMTDVVNKIRTAVRSGRRSNLGVCGSLPGGAMDLFAKLVKWPLFGRVSAVAFKDKMRTDYENAMKEVTDIQDGKVEFVAPAIVGENVLSGAWGSDAPICIDSLDPVPVGEDDGLS